jgi:hypothetical protein
VCGFVTSGGLFGSGGYETKGVLAIGKADEGEERGMGGMCDLFCIHVTRSYNLNLKVICVDANQRSSSRARQVAHSTLAYVLQLNSVIVLPSVQHVHRSPSNDKGLSDHDLRMTPP